MQTAWKTWPGVKSFFKVENLSKKPVKLNVTLRIGPVGGVHGSLHCRQLLPPSLPGVQSGLRILFVGGHQCWGSTSNLLYSLSRCCYKREQKKNLSKPTKRSQALLLISIFLLIRIFLFHALTPGVQHIYISREFPGILGFTVSDPEILGWAKIGKIGISNSSLYTCYTYQLPIIMIASSNFYNYLLKWLQESMPVFLLIWQIMLANESSGNTHLTWYFPEAPQIFPSDTLNLFPHYCENVPLVGIGPEKFSMTTSN